MLVVSRAAGARTTDGPAGTLWYDRPAERWFEALPIGNGRLGGMVYGGTGTERIRLSESTAWSGAPSTADVSPTARQCLPALRELLFAGRYPEAQRLAAEHLPGRPSSFGTNVPLPEVRLDCATGAVVTNYRRGLDLDTGIVSVAYDQGGATFTRETFASHPHGVIAVRLTADRPGAIGFTVGIGGSGAPGRVAGTDTGVAFHGGAFESLHSDGHQGTAVEIRVHVTTSGGAVRRRAEMYEVTGANSAVLLIGVGTDWAGEDPADRVDVLIATAARAGYETLRAAHVNDHSGLMRRVSIDLGSTVDDTTWPTDARRNRLARGERDDGLLALYFQYGRYLTVAGSRAGSPLPLALQGIWNDGLASGASWTDDFHLDMNTQQNYWAAEPTNLAECHVPLFGLVRLIAGTGRDTATEMYGAPGWVAHTVTNAWGYTAPGTGMGWGLHVTGGAWLAMHLWEHYEYGLDEKFLRDQVYPVFRGAAEFLLAYLVPEPEHGWLVAGPAESPENWYLAPDGTRCSVAMGTTVDRVFTEAVLRVCAEAGERLGVDPELRTRIAAARSRLSPFQVGRHGQLQEWLHDVEEADPAHRHTSHLCALFPERQITPRGTPELARAAAVTIERRQQAPGWEQTEWVEANFTVYYARLRRGDLALAHLTRLVTHTSEANLMTYSAGGVAGAAQNIYSFDGNAGGAAGVAEMLLQSDGEEIELLPALPAVWRAGAVRGLRARGRFTVDLAWRDGRLDHARIRPDRTGIHRVRYRDQTDEIAFVAGEDIILRYRD
jgi:alpha-L-fucosidase 2